MRLNAEPSIIYWLLLGGSQDSSAVKHWAFNCMNPGSVMKASRCECENLIYILAQFEHSESRWAPLSRHEHIGKV